MSEEEDLFMQEMQGVTPHKKAQKVQVDKQPSLDASVDIRREAAQQEPTKASDELSVEYAPPLGPHDEISFALDGVQAGVLRKLRLGQYSCEATLDLHGKTVLEARKEVLAFIQQSIKYDLRTVMITHGKGLKSERGYSLLKSFVALWLPQLKEVLACHSAQSYHGGRGAVYVLLRKSEKKKNQNRERHSRRKPPS